MHAMQRVNLKAVPKGPGAQAELIRRASEAANDLLETSGRVLVVYGEDGARIYYDAPVRLTRPVA